MGRGARSGLARLVDLGLVLRAAGRDRPAARRRYREYVQVSNVAPELAGLAHRAPRQEAFVSRLLAEDGPLVLAEARREYGAGAVNAVLAKGWAEKLNVAEERDPLAGTAFPSTGPVVLTPDQTAVASEIRLSLETSGPSPRTFLVHGVTGSGKTEIYLDAAHHCLRLGKRAIILVPEIALTHQTIERFAARFPGEVAVLHSGLSAGERFDQWWKIKQGEYGLVVGSRGAVFAPQPDLGLVVMDEEHEWTYKQADSTPRYHAREVAYQLAKLTGAVVVLGSATPDVGSYYTAARGRSQLASLPDRVIPVEGDSSKGAVSAPLASVDVVDMRRELREGNRNIFSRVLTDSLSRCLVAGEQAILFLNRRGSASYMLCRNCGASLRCRRCDVSLTYHKALDRLVCHYCGYRHIPPTSCPRCLGYRLSFYGIGTQSVAAEVSEKFPEAKVLRWDRDAVKNARSYQEMLRLFRAGEAQVLVGTQMIAKGLHFPSVTLVGVVSADVGLNIPDYQAGERAFQLLYQVAGRAGRGRAGGRVIVQTYQPDNYAVQAAASQDYQRFFSKEAEFRREQGNPPFSKLVRLLYTHTNSALCEREASRLAGLIRRQSEGMGHIRCGAARSYTGVSAARARALPLANGAPGIGATAAPRNSSGAKGLGRRR